MKWDQLRTGCMSTQSYRDGHLYTEQHRNQVAEASSVSKQKNWSTEDGLEELMRQWSQRNVRQSRKIQLTENQWTNESIGICS